MYPISQDHSKNNMTHNVHNIIRSINSIMMYTRHNHSKHIIYYL